MLRQKALKENITRFLDNVFKYLAFSHYVMHKMLLKSFNLKYYFNIFPFFFLKRTFNEINIINSILYAAVAINITICMHTRRKKNSIHNILLGL